MADVRILQDGGKDIIPVTHEDAVLDNSGVAISKKYAKKEDLTKYAKKEDLNNIDLSEINNAIEDLNDKYDELFQSANNGKELIADAIGEPVSSEDTFSAMSNDIKSLLSTFKTNLMNSGVTVASGDKFKQLIDKIKGLTEGEGNKGIQYDTGAYSLGGITTFDEYDSDDNKWYRYYYQSIKIPKTSDLNFIYVYTDYDYSFIHEDDGQTYHMSISDCILYDPVKQTLSDGSVYVFARSIYYTYNSNGVQVDYGSWYTYLKLIDNTDHVVLPLIGTYSYYDGNTKALTSDDITYNVYYTVGLGEEDTTLRDSLASILQEEGVTVTEEDDMANLISKTDSTFDSKRQSLYDILTSKNLECSPDESFDDLLSKLMQLDSYAPYKSKIKKVTGEASYFSNYDYSGYRVTFPSDCVTPRFIIGTFTIDSTKCIYYYDFTTKYYYCVCNASEGVFMLASPPFSPAPYYYDNVIELFMHPSTSLGTVNYILYYDSSDYVSNIEGSSILLSVQGYRDFSNVTCFYTTMDKDTFDKLEFLHISSIYYSSSEYSFANVIYDKNVSNSLLVFDPSSVYDYDWGYGYSTVNIIREGNLVYIPVIYFTNDEYTSNIMEQPYMCIMYSKDSVSSSGTNSLIDGVLYNYANQIDPCNITSASVFTTLDSRYLNNLKHEVSTQYGGLHLGLTPLGSSTGLSLEVAVPLMIDLGIPATTINQYSTCTLTYKAPYYTTVEFIFGFVDTRSAIVNEVKYKGVTSGYNNTKTVTFNIDNKYSTSNGNLVMYLWVIATQNYPNYNIIEKITFQ